jgi:hypothetical protein
MGLAEQLLYVFLATFFAGYMFRTFKIREQLADPGKYERMIEELGVVPSERTVSKIEIIVCALIVLLILFATFDTAGVTLDDWAVQMILTTFAGLLAGYFYRTYKLKQQLMSPEAYKGLLQSFGFIPTKRKTTKIELMVEAIIVLLIIYAIYLSFGAPI